MSHSDFIRRKEQVLISRVEARKAKTHPHIQQLMGMTFGLANAVILFFALKGAALSHGNVTFAPEPGPEATFSDTAYFWFAGADPLSNVFAQAIRMQNGEPFENPFDTGLTEHAQLPSSGIAFHRAPETN